MKNLLKILIITFCISASLFTLNVYAQTQNSQYVPLEQLPGLSTTVNGKPTINLAEYLPNLVKLAIGLAAALSVIYIIIGGFKYISTDAIFEKKEGKETITNAVWGLLLAISSVVILNTISPKILNVNLKIEPTKVEDLLAANQTGGGYTQPTQVAPGTGNCVCADSVTVGFYGTISQYNVTNGTSCKLACSCDNAGYFSFQSPNIYAGVDLSCPAKNGSPTSGTGNSWSSDQTDRTAFTNLSQNISFNRDNCQTIGQSGCTSVLDIGTAVINGVGQLARKCNCSVIVTGGTEYWLHSVNTAHRAGGNVVDLSINTPVTAYIEKNGQRLPNDTSCSTGIHYKLDGAIYVNEQIDGNAPHWHVCY